MILQPDTVLNIPFQSTTERSASRGSQLRSAAVGIVESAAGIATAICLATLGISMISAGVYTGYTTASETLNFYWPYGEEDRQGYKDFPGFETACNSLLNTAHSFTGYPEKGEEFCAAMCEHPFDEINVNRAGVLTASIATTCLGGMASIFLTTGGIACLGHSFKLFHSSVWGR